MYNVALTLRLIEETYNKIKTISEKENRSINAEINYILKKYIEEYEKQKDCNKN